MGKTQSNPMTVLHLLTGPAFGLFLFGGDVACISFLQNIMHRTGSTLLTHLTGTRIHSKYYSTDQSIITLQLWGATPVVIGIAEIWCSDLHAELHSMH